MSDYVWVATDLYPESSEVHVAATEGALLRVLVASIGRSEYEDFAAQLEGDQRTDVTYDAEPEDVLRVWAGEMVDDDSDEPDRYTVGNDWLVRKVEVAR